MENNQKKMHYDIGMIGLGVMAEIYC